MKDEVASRADLPTGTVTFLFSDIEGSTRLLDALGDRYPVVLETHQRILRGALGARGGIEVSTEGDSFFVVFLSAPQAVAAAVEAQRAIAAHEWPTEAPLRIRMGVHTGEGTIGGDNYVGVDLHRAARIAAAGHGGQIVVSEATRALVEPAAPEGVTFRDLGEHRLKDLSSPERLHQVVAQGLPSDFPALRSMDARPNNLPVQLTSFVGRRRELEEVKEAVRAGRLLTLTGPGGTGKTRLALQTAHELLPEFEQGVFFVALAPITERGLVLPAVAKAIGLPEATKETTGEALVEHLRDKRLLLVTDNFEQVLDAAPDVGMLLSSTEGVSVLATSREPLGLSGEREYPVPPLGLPDPAHLPAVEGLSQYEAVSLFVDRATAVQPGFQVTNENAPAVAEICARLDGLPLAIELAAARVKILGPDAMLARLDRALPLLAGGSRDRPQRQRTLRDAIAWSYDLLDEAERRLFARVSAFVGGFSLEAADAVADPGGFGLDAFDGIASLANKSLLRQMVTGPEEPRFFMLETIREYAGERLAELPDADEIRRRHARFFLALAERAEPELTGPDQVRWLDALEAEHDNFRAALAWAAGHDLDTALRMGGALWRFWQFRGHLREALERLEGILERPGPWDEEARARALEGAGGVAYWMGDFARAGRRYEECLAIRVKLGKPRGIAEAKYNLAFAHGISPGPTQDLPLATRLLEEALAGFRELDDPEGTAKATWGLATMAYGDEDWEQVARLSTDSVEMFRRLDNPFGLAWALHLQGLALAILGRPDEAEASLREAMDIFLGTEDRSAAALLLADLAILADSRGQHDRALRLAGAAETVEQEVGTGLLVSDSTVSKWLRRLRGRLPELETEPLLDEGRAMSMDEALAYGKQGLGATEP
ncbi:MAG TPA: adenylate/guanylate cyclase domain-containing protein [Actinomycetota bacterium]|nr:adenylate/guanylate cyclase domain-containing protein [Actinomycetota bacterium]